ncbi:polyphosphate kinase 2 [Roseinatronobacter monicus]
MSAIPMPFDGQVTEYLTQKAPQSLRCTIEDARKRDTLAGNYPYPRWMKKSDYQDALQPLQFELAKLQHWLAETEQRVIVIFEGRDTAGKSGAINRITEVTNPRTVRVEALPKPTDRQRREWFFQRYVERLPAGGEMVLFDRSWYNRAVIEHVFGFCTPDQRARFFHQVPEFERMLVGDGVHLIKIWLNVSRAEQFRRLLARESNPMRHWKLSQIDIDGLAKWDSYTHAIAQTFERTHTMHAPWTVIRSEDKYRARLAVLQHILGTLPYALKDAANVTPPDPEICGTPAIWDAELWDDGT